MNYLIWHKELMAYNSLSSSVTHASNGLVQIYVKGILRSVLMTLPRCKKSDFILYSLRATKPILTKSCGPLQP